MDQQEDSLFSTDKQRHIVGSALTAIAVVTLSALLYGVFFVLQSLVTTFSHVIWPLAIAGILALLLRPIVTTFEKSLKFSRAGAILLLLIIVTGVSLLLAASVLPVLFKQLNDFLFSSLPSIVSRAVAFGEEKFPELAGNGLFDNMSLGELARKALAAGQQFVVTSLSAVGTATTGVMNFVGTATAFAVIPVYLFYLLKSDTDFLKEMRGQMSFIRPGVREDLVFLVEEFIDILVAFFRGQILIGMILGLMLGVGLMIVGLQFGFVLGFVVGLINIIPYLGTILGLSTMLPIAYFQQGGGWELVGLVLLVFAVGQVINDYLVAPKIMGQQTGLHPMAIMVSLFFWATALNGILGMVLAIPLTAFFVVFWRLLKRKYLPSYAVGLGT